MQCIDKNIEGNKTWQVNVHLTGNLNYLQAKHTICKGRKHRPAKQVNMTNCHSASSPFTTK